MAVSDVLRIGRGADPAILQLAARFGVNLIQLAPGEQLPGSYWGEAEAGLRGDTLYVRADTPLHSLLHELSHYVCMTPDRRASLDRDAGGDDAEECGVCYLQIVLADEIPILGHERMLRDMDEWGYTFRLGSSGAWFAQDSADARIWLVRHGVLDEAYRPTFRLRS